MVRHVVLCQLKPGTDEHALDDLMRQTHSRLLRIHECLTVQCGKRIEPDNAWAFFFTVDYETRAKLRLAQKKPAYAKFLAEVITPRVAAQMAMLYELDPDKNVKYS
ncbi:MAG: Dabb family protein [Verrucomicrobia bacterium]|nr:Dabb family protein [Verrucomicrobiota bacterium]